MHDASCLGGFAFTNAWLGIAHSLAHQIGGQFGVPHGCANAIVLPNVIRFNAKGTERYADLAKLVGKTTAEEFAVAIEELRSKVGIVSSVKVCGIAAEEWNAHVKDMTQHAFADPCTSFNPRAITVEELEQMFMSCYEGEKVNF